MERSMGLLFYLKKRKQDPVDRVPVYFRITVDGIKKEISTKQRADTTKWSVQAQRLTGRTDTVRVVNDCLDVLYTKAIQARTQLIALNKPVTADHIAALVQGQPLEQYMLMDIFTEHNKK